MDNGSTISRCTNSTTIDGLMTVSCKLGFWSVSGRDHKFVINEAMHYFQQYFSDGEYKELLEPTQQQH